MTSDDPWTPLSTRCGPMSYSRNSRMLAPSHPVMLCDTRLVTKGYGRSFITSLPPMRRTREFADVRTFLREKLA